MRQGTGSPGAPRQAGARHLKALLDGNQDWLVDRILDYAKRHGFTKETSTLREAWRLSVEGLSNSLLEVLGAPEFDIGAAEDPLHDPAASYVVPVLRAHRARGVSLRQFLALFKYYRRAYIDLLTERPQAGGDLRDSIDYAFDRIEIAMAASWETTPSAEVDAELRAANRFQTRQKNKYLTIFESLREPVFFIDVEGNIENLNAAAARTFARTAPQGGTYYSRGLDLHWPTAADIPEILASAVGGVFERSLPTAHGECWFEVKASAMLDVSGKFTGTIVTCTDISERRRAARILDDSERRYRGLFESMTSGFALHEMVFDEAGVPRDYRFLELNKAFESLTGLKAAEIVGRTVLDVLPQTEPFWIETYGEVVQTGRPAHFEHFSPEVDRHFEIVAYSPQRGQFAVICRDVSDRKRGEQRLRESEAMFRQIAESIGEVIWLRDRSGMIYVSPAFERVWGVSREDLYGNPRLFLESIVPEDRERILERIDSLALTQEGRFDEEYRITHPDGSIRWIWARTFPLLGSGSALRVGIAEDITDRKHHEARLVEAKTHAEAAKRTQSEFLANMSHELRTPLNSILGFSEIMAGEMLGPMGVDRYLEYARDIHASGQLLLKIINDILDLSRVEVGVIRLKEEPCDAAEILRAVARILAHRAREKGLSFEVASGQGVPPLCADPLRLKQILLNLGSNAVKFTQPGGRVSLHASWHEKDGHEFVVADTGIGMSAAEIQVALKPFGQVASAQRRAHQGTGLGLPIAQSLVHLHGARLDIESAPDRGTTVKVRFPPDRTPLPPDVPPTAAA